MFAMTMTMRVQGPFGALVRELEATPSARRRMQLIHKLALSHMTEMIDRIMPFLGDEPRVRHAAARALVSFGEDARQPMLDLLGDMHRCELHAGAVTVLAGIVRDQTGGPPVRWRAHDRRDPHLQGLRGPGVE
jgi:hypothetical protein